jgi:hypothetical protein
MNKKGGGESLMFFAFVLIMVIIVIGIVLGVNSFFGRGYDVRTVESEQLSERIESCFQQNNFFELEFNESIYEKCKLNKEVSEKHLIFIGNENKEFFVGVLDYKNQCYFGDNDENPQFPRCTQKTITKNGETFILVVGSNQQARRIR